MPLGNTPLLADPRLAVLPVHECGERLVSLAADGRIRIDFRRHDPLGNHTHVRAGVAARLQDVQHKLLRRDYRRLRERFGACTQAQLASFAILHQVVPLNCAHASLAARMWRPADLLPRAQRHFQPRAPQ